MDDATKKALGEFITQALDAAKAGAQWTADQTPLLVQEWLRWQALQAAVILAVCVVGMAVLLAIAWRVHKFIQAKVAVKERWEDPEFGYVFLGIGVLFCGGFLSDALIRSALLLGKVLVAPRVVVIEKLSELIK